MAYANYVKQIEDFEKFGATKEELINILEEIRNRYLDHCKEYNDKKEEIRKYEEGNINKEVSEDAISEEELKGLYIDAEMLQHKCDCYDELIRKTTGLLDEYKYFNKWRTIKNIRYLLNNSDIKIGDIEREARVASGYISRIAREGSTTDPSIEFLMAISKIFKINISDLLNSDLENESDGFTPNEVSVYEFIKQIFMDTNNGTIVWKKYDKENFKEDVIPYEALGADYEHSPFLNHYEERLNQDNTFDGYVYSFRSWFYDDYKYAISDVVYEGTLRNNSYIVLLPITYLSGANLKTSVDEFEVYILKNGKVIPICSTYKAKGCIKNSIIDLYNIVTRFIANINLTSEAKSFIDDYLSVLELPFK